MSLAPPGIRLVEWGHKLGLRIFQDTRTGSGTGCPGRAHDGHKAAFVQFVPDRIH